jgi:hypothetical protein
MRLVKEAYASEAAPAPALALGVRRTLFLWGLSAALIVLGVCPAALDWFSRP